MHRAIWPIGKCFYHLLEVPTSFSWTERSSGTDRSLLLFYAASPNSCTRAHIDASFDGYNASDVLVTRTVPRHLYAEYLYDAKYCFVPDGFSSISARLYEVMLHGCVPVIVSEAFTPPCARFFCNAPITLYSKV